MLLTNTSVLFNSPSCYIPIHQYCSIFLSVTYQYFSIVQQSFLLHTNTPVSFNSPSCYIPMHQYCSKQTNKHRILSCSLDSRRAKICSWIHGVAIGDLMYLFDISFQKEASPNYGSIKIHFVKHYI